LSTIPDSIDRLIEEFSRFPGIGRKTAQRMVFHVLKSPNDHAVELAQAVMDMKTKIRFCSICNGITEEDPCKICTNPKRDQSSICIVEEAADIYTFEKNLSEVFNVAMKKRCITFSCTNLQHIDRRACVTQ